MSAKVESPSIAVAIALIAAAIGFIAAAIGAIAAPTGVIQASIGAIEACIDVIEAPRRRIRTYAVHAWALSHPPGARHAGQVPATRRYDWTPASFRDAGCDSMTNERRSARRIPGPFDGGWNGESGSRECRITDLSAGGCFIDSLSNNAVGTKVNVQIRLAGQVFQLRAVVAYVDRVQGFAVTFTNNDAATMQAFADAVQAVESQPVGW